MLENLHDSITFVLVDMDSKRRQLLSASSVNTINTSCLAYEKVVETLLNATITIGEFQQIQPLQDKILELSVVSQGLYLKQDDIRMAFNSRNAELNNFTGFLFDFGDLWQTCKEFFPPGMSIYRARFAKDMINSLITDLKST